MLSTIIYIYNNFKTKIINRLPSFVTIEIMDIKCTVSSISHQKILCLFHILYSYIKNN